MNQLQAMTTNDFRAFLEQELGRRSSANPNYSLRAFARDLGVDSSFLSKLLNGKRSMTARTILTLAPRLSLSEEQIQNFVQGANGRRRRYPLNSLEIQTLQEIEDQRVAQMLDWYHMAVMALFDVKGFQASATWIAERLGIEVTQAQQALDDLMGTGLLCQNAQGEWIRQIDRHTVSSRKFPHVNLVKKQILEQAAEMVPKQIGDHSAMTISVANSRLDEAIERIRKFRRELAHFLNEPSEKDSVYHLAISLFPVTK